MATPRSRFPGSDWVSALLLLVALALPRARAAPAAEFTSRSWHVEDGLPGEEIVALAQDARGFLWVATTAGLARFDGAHFEPYPVAPDPRTYTRVIATAPGLGLIAALPGDGVVRFEHDGFHSLTPWPLEHESVQSLLVAPDQSLWIAGESGTLLRRAPDGVAADAGAPALPRNGVRSLATDARGRVWFATNGYVARRDGDRWTKWPDRFRGAELRIGSSARGAPWLVTRDRVLRLEDDRAVEVARVPPLVSAHYIHALAEDREGDLWIGTRSQGLFVLAQGELHHVPTSQEEITALCGDAAGDMWVGTNGGGLDRIRRKPYRLYDTSTGLRQNLSYSVFVDEHGDVWLANRDGGVARIHDGGVENIVVPSTLPALSAISLFRAPGGGVGVTSGSGIFQLPDRPGGALRKIDGVPSLPIVRVTFSARNGDVWFSIDPDRIGRLHAGRFETFGTAEGFDGKQVRGIAEDSAGRIWVGTTDGRVFREEGARFTAVPLDGIATGAINCIAIDPDDTVWLGTVSAGIVGWSRAHARSCSVAQGLPDENIAAIISDGRGYFWCASKRAVFRVPRRELTAFMTGGNGRIDPLVVGQEDGVRGLSSSGGFQPACGRTPDGQLWFATRRGVLAIDPAKPAAPPGPPPVAVEEVREDDMRRPLHRPLIVGPGVRKLQLRFGVLNLSAPDRVLARYRLVGFDTDWIPAGSGRVATYPRLPPGDYQFEVTARNADTAAAEARDTLRIRFLPAWWQTWWFRLGGFSLAGCGIAGLARLWTHRRLRRRLERLERETAVERERTRIAQNIHDDVGASLTRISLLAQHAQHEVAGGAKFFDEIYGTAAAITRSLDEIVWAVNPRFDNIEGLANYLGNFAQRFLDVARLRCRLDIPDRLPPIPLTSDARHNIFLCLKEALNNVVRHAGATAVRLGVALRDDELVVTIEDDGRGLATAAADRAGGRRGTGGNGLENMRQRMAAVGGACGISSSPGRGTRVVLSVPVRMPRAGPAR